MSETPKRRIRKTRTETAVGGNVTGTVLSGSFSGPVTMQYGQNRIVITCRTAATEYMFEGFNYCELADFSPTQVQTFVTNWFRTQPAKLTAFNKAFRHPNNKGLVDLARTPLLLTMLCLTFDEIQTFPTRRVELYDEALDALLKRWDNSRSITRDDLPLDGAYRKLSLSHKRQLLAEIAAKAFDRGELFLSKEQLAEQIVTFLRRLPPSNQDDTIEGEIIVHAMEAQHGILIERARAVYSFSHLTFQEYFTARYIADRSVPTVFANLVTHAADARWREVLLLTSSLLSYKNAASLFSIWCDGLDNFTRSEPTLEELFAWVTKNSKQTIGLRGVQQRVDTCAVVLQDQFYRFVSTLVGTLTGVRATTITLSNAFTAARTSARASARTLADALSTTNVLVRAINQASARASLRVRALDHVSALTNILTNTSKFVGTSELVSASELAAALSKAVSSAGYVDHMSARFAASNLDRANGNVLVLDRDLERAIGLARSFVSSYKAPIGVTGLELSEQHYPALVSYFVQMHRLLECLELASIDHRDRIYNRLLVRSSEHVSDQRGQSDDEL